MCTVATVLIRSISLSVQVVFCVYNRFEELRGDGGARL